MNNGLKIYACSGIGSAEEINGYKYWTDDTKDYSNSPAVNSLLSLINETNVECLYLDLTKSEKIEKYNKLDFYIVCLVLAQSHLANEQKASVIQHMYNDGSFSFDSINDLEREDHLNQLIDNALSDQQTYTNSGDIYKWFLTDIASRNEVVFSTAEQRKIASAINSVSGIGSTDYGSLTECVENAGQYFLYRFIPEKKRNLLSNDVQKKIKKQDEFYEYVLENWAPAYGTKDDLDRVIRVNIISNYKTTPEKAVEALMRGEGIGVVTEAAVATATALAKLIEIILACIVALTSIIVSVLQACQTVIAAKATAKYAVPDNIEDGCPSSEDWPEAEAYAEANADKNKWITMGIIGAVVLLIMKL